jgi:SAM-dependent methyltransferases related to tRNA (uracil-5-)-methyltransferase
MLANMLDGFNHVYFFVFVHDEYDRPSKVTGIMSSRKEMVGKKYKKPKSKQNDVELSQIMNDILQENNNDPASSRKGKVTYMVASAASALHQGQALGAGVLIVDPPRKGLEEEVLVQLCKPHNPKQLYTEDPLFLQGPRYSINWVNDVHTLIYVSCGFDALASDCDRLLKGNAGWKLESATGYILFPGSNHVETVAIFKRKAGRETLL